MPRKRLLVSDIDGTLLNDGRPTPGLATLRRALAAHSDEVGLVYATGRSFRSTSALIEAGVLPRADGIAAFVGTEVWRSPWREPDPEYDARIADNWNAPTVRRVAEQLPALELQPDEFQSGRKASYYLDDPALLPDLERALSEAGLAARLIYSGGRYLDVVPLHAGKRAAVVHLCRRWRLTPGSVLVCGDSGNDIDMLEDPRLNAVAVGNSAAELKGVARTAPIYQSSLHHAAGVIEGAAALGFWPAR